MTKPDETDAQASPAKKQKLVHEPNDAAAREMAALIPYYPFKGIDRFYDIGGLLAHPDKFDQMCETFAARYRAMGLTHICGFDARGFLFTPVAIKLGIPFVMLRKKGKMPNTISSTPYTKEYAGVSEICITRGSVGPGARVLLIDDLIATGGTLCAGIELIKACGGTVASCGCMVELVFLEGRKKCLAAGAEDVWSFISEDMLTTEATLPADYVDDGEAH